MMPQNKPAKSIGSATLRGSALTIGTQWGARIIGLGSTVILARVLAPSDFGVFALALTVPVILGALTNVSVLDYLQRAESLDREKLDTAFTISFARGILLSILVLLAAVMADFVQADRRLPTVLCAFALSPLIDSFSNPRSAEYARTLDFASLARRQIFTKLAGAMASIIGAIILRSYWALVIGSLVRSIAWLVITYVGKPYRPRFSLADWRDALAFSIWLTFRSMIDVLGKQADRLVVAHWAGLVAVGNFAVAQDFAWMTAAELFDTAQNVLFPAFGKFRNKRAELQANVVETYAFLLALALPWTIGAALVGPQIMILIYGNNWGPASEMVAPLAIALAFQSTETIATALVLATGSPRTLTMRTAITTTFRLSLLITGLIFFDVQTAIWLLVPASIVTAAINLALLRAVTNLPLGVFATSAWRSWVSAGLMAAIVLGVDRLIPNTNNSMWLVTDLSLKIAVGAGSYVVAHLLLWYSVGLPYGPEARMLKIVSGSGGP